MLRIEDNSFDQQYQLEPFPRPKQNDTGSISPEMLFRFNPSRYMKEVIVKQN